MSDAMKSMRGSNWIKRIIRNVRLSGVALAAHSPAFKRLSDVPLALAMRMFLSFSVSVFAPNAASGAGADPAPAAGKAVAEKIAAAGTEKEISKREKLYRELGEARDAAATAVLSRAALSDPEPGARIDAILALRKIGGPEALKALLNALAAEKHKGVRIQAVNSLGFFNAPEAMVRLRDVAKNDTDKDLRISAVMALSRLNDAETLAAGFDAEKDPAAKLAIVDALSRVESGEKELKKVKIRNKDAKIGERLDFYTGEKKKKAKKK